MTPTPTALRLDDETTLIITWDNGTTTDYSVRKLRDICPCATCREKRRTPVNPEELTILTPEETQPLRIGRMHPVGNYAYAIEFSDGHDTGIFTLDFLWNLRDQGSQ